MLRRGQILKVRRAHVIHVLGVERAQLVGCIECGATGIVGAHEMLLCRIERHRLIEIEIANVIDRQLVVEAEAVGEIEFHFPNSKNYFSMLLLDAKRNGRRLSNKTITFY